MAPTRRSREERVTFRWRRFFLFDISGGHSFYCPTLPDHSGRDTREAVAGSTGDTGASPRAANQKSRHMVETRIATRNHPQTLTPGTCRTGVGTIQATANGRLAHASFGLSTRNLLESISGECSPGVDDVSVMLSPLESDDRSGRHSNKSGTANGTDLSQHHHVLDV